MTYFSMFSGIGGFELAADKAFQNAECAGYSEINKHAVSIYKKHFKEHKNYGNATTIIPSTIPDHELLFGGFPCQTFSVAGKRAGFSDTRGTLFFEMCRVIRKKQPRFLLFENVKGLLSHDQGNTFAKVLSALAGLGYDVEWQLYNSANFTAQNRERVYITGRLRSGSRAKILFKPQTTKENFGGNQSKRDERIICVSSCRTFGQKNINKKDGGSGILYRDDNRSYAILAKDSHLILENKGRAQAERVYSPKAKSSALCAGGGGLGGKTGLYLVNERVRSLTPKECERLQGFPDDWTKFDDKGKELAKTNRNKCIGNAVTVDVAEFAMRNL